MRAPEGNGGVERFIRTLKENLLWVRRFATIEDLEKRFGRDRSVFDQPSLFFAASSRADEAVVASIREVLEEHTGERIRLVVCEVAGIVRTGFGVG